MSTIKTDILIIGGGIAGCIAAISLADTLHVTLVDKLAKPRDRIGESLAPASNRILKELDLLSDMEALTGVLFKKNLGMQSYWGSDQVHLVDHLRNPDGFVKSLNRKAFENYLRESAQKRGVKCLWGAKLYNSTYEDLTWNVQIQPNNEMQTQSIAASFVLDASGRQSHFARSLGIRRHVEDQLIACWITLPNTEVNTMSTISASENGWWYSAVAPGNKRIVAFHTDSDLIDKGELKTKESFLRLTNGNKQISELLKGKESAIQFQGTVAANSTKLEQVAGQKWAALGDAALSFDPLSSQGMFNAMANAMQFKKLLLQFGFTDQLPKFFIHQLDQIWLHYLKHKRIFYQTETRWKTSEFWSRRHHQF